jgi:sugar phosphate isomerase/epimerase
MSLPVAIQMYTLREETAKDFVGTLKKVAEIGYHGVELAGFGGLSANDLKGVLDDLGLRVAASHVGLPLWEDSIQNVIDYHLALGANHVVCPSIPVDRRNQFETYEYLVDFLNKVGEQCKNAGLTLSYHNHDFDLIRFEGKFDGKTALEYLLEQTNPEWVKAEFDIYWLTRAGEDPVEWLKKYSGRTPLVHLKDMTTDGEEFFAELGTGGVNITGVVGQGPASQVEWWIVEQDRCKRDPLESITMSMDYLKREKIIG